MKIAILTSSRADYGIYRPLLRALGNDPLFELEIVAFGTHMSPYHGMTINEILDDGFDVRHQLETLVLGDSPDAITSNMAITFIKMSGIWNDLHEHIDLAFCLGDRYEMFSAVSASVPFNIPLAHIHGGETTLGAIDNVFRHSITHMSKYHFASTAGYVSKIKTMIGNNSNVFNVGALSLDNLKNIKLYTPEEFENIYSVDLSKPTILFTFHPETIHPEKNGMFIQEIIGALEELKEFQVVITMPNSDTGNIKVRQELEPFITRNKDRVYVFKSLGTRGYFSCMEHSRFLMGNTSSGIIEAASLGKYVIDLGNRQKGRLAGNNVLHVDIHKEKILNAVQKIERKPGWDRSNIYWNGGASAKIIEVLKSIHHSKKGAYETGILC